MDKIMDDVDVDMDMGVDTLFWRFESYIYVTFDLSRN